MSDSEIEGPAPAETACDSLHLWHQAVATLAAVVLVLCAARLADRKRVAAAREEVTAEARLVAAAREEAVMAREEAAIAREAAAAEATPSWRRR